MHTEWGVCGGMVGECVILYTGIARVQPLFAHCVCACRSYTSCVCMSPTRVHKHKTNQYLNTPPPTPPPLFSHPLPSHYPTHYPTHYSLITPSSQIYADPCFLEVPELIEWGKYNHVRDLHKAIALPATDSLKRNVTAWYFNHYMKSFQRDRILEVMSSIPQICEWDDHDVYDGRWWCVGGCGGWVGGVGRAVGGGSGEGCGWG